MAGRFPHSNQNRCNWAKVGERLDRRVSSSGRVAADRQQIPRRNLLWVAFTDDPPAAQPSSAGFSRRSIDDDTHRPSSRVAAWSIGYAGRTSGGWRRSCASGSPVGASTMPTTCSTRHSLAFCPDAGLGRPPSPATIAENARMSHVDRRTTSTL